MNCAACCWSVVLLVVSTFGIPQSSRAQNPPKLNAQQLLARGVALNGLATANRPWHVLAKFEQSDPRTGRHADSGTFEEWWYAPQSYKTIYKSEKLSQTDVLTPAGLYRSGDQQWMDAWQAQVTHVLLRPMPRSVDTSAPPLLDLGDSIGGVKLRCLSYGVSRPGQYDAMGSRTPNFDPLAAPTYCVTQEGVLRTVTAGGIEYFFNDLTPVQGRVLARTIKGIVNNKPVLDVTVVDAEPLPADAVPPSPEPGSTGPTTGPIELPSGRMMVVSGRDQFDYVVRTQLPRDNTTEVALRISIDEQGHVYDAKAISGPEPFASAIAKAAFKCTYNPFFLGDKPIRVDIIDKVKYTEWNRVPVSIPR